MGGFNEKENHPCCQRKPPLALYSALHALRVAKLQRVQADLCAVAGHLCRVQCHLRGCASTSCQRSSRPLSPALRTRAEGHATGATPSPCLMQDQHLPSPAHGGGVGGEGCCRADHHNRV